MHEFMAPEGKWRRYQASELTVGALGAETLWHSGLGVGQARDLLLPLLDDDEVVGLDVAAHDATTNGFAAALSSSALAVAAVALSKQETHTVGSKDTL